MVAHTTIYIIIQKEAAAAKGSDDEEAAASDAGPKDELADFFSEVGTGGGGAVPGANVQREVVKVVKEDYAKQDLGELSVASSAPCLADGYVPHATLQPHIMHDQAPRRRRCRGCCSPTTSGKTSTPSTSSSSAPVRFPVFFLCVFHMLERRPRPCSAHSSSIP